jgi:hypothetical protein
LGIYKQAGGILKFIKAIEDFGSNMFMLLMSLRGDCGSGYDYFVL